MSDSSGHCYRRKRFLHFWSLGRRFGEPFLCASRWSALTRLTPSDLKLETLFSVESTVCPAMELAMGNALAFHGPLPLGDFVGIGQNTSSSSSSSSATNLLKRTVRACFGAGVSMLEGGGTTGCLDVRLRKLGGKKRLVGFRFVCHVQVRFTYRVPNPIPTAVAVLEFRSVSEDDQDNGRQMFRCPFENCPQSHNSAKGWLTKKSLISHLNSLHLSAPGSVLPSSCSLNFDICPRCNLIIYWRGCSACQGRRGAISVHWVVPNSSSHLKAALRHILWC